MAVTGGRLAELRWKSVESVQAEIAREKARGLGRTAEALEKAIARLEEIDAGPGPDGASMRAEAMAAASRALWSYVVQREACGLRDVRWCCESTAFRARCTFAWATRRPGARPADARRRRTH
jgi:hypothetical protein